MKRSEHDAWAADTAISRPDPPSVPVMVDFDGFGFTMNGMAHNLSSGEIEELVIPTFAPEGYQGFNEPIDFEEEERQKERDRFMRGEG